MGNLEQPTSDAVTFAIGEIAILCPPVDVPGIAGGIPRGSEVTIASGLVLRRPKWPDGKIDVPMYVYLIHTSEGRQYCCPPGWLRKKKPPREDLSVVHWDQCPWQPESLRA